MKEHMDIIWDLLIETLRINEIEVTLHDFDCFAAIKARKAGKSFSDEQHLEGIVFALLSSQRPWKPILNNYQKIKELFGDFNYQYIFNQKAEYFEQGIRELKCGNKSIHRQMQALQSIVLKLEYIKEKHGGLDSFVVSDNPVNIAMLISSNKEYKIPELGFALALEYLRNIGIDVAKPDSQLCRLFGNKRLGLSSHDIASPNEVVRYIEEIANANEVAQAEVGTTFWMLCAKDYGNICSQKPNCSKCKLYIICNIKSEKYTC